MRERRKLTENAEDDFNVMDTKQIAKRCPAPSAR